LNRIKLGFFLLLHNSITVQFGDGQRAVNFPTISCMHCLWRLVDVSKESYVCMYKEGEQKMFSY